MRFLHTSDWHLGMRLYGMDRKEEHAHFLKWLLSQIDTLNIDVLLVTGDIFDTSNPPQDALQMYYHFLSEVSKIKTCSAVVIIGGNHDSANVLNAPKDLLKSLNIHVIGCSTGNIQDEIIPIGNGDTPDAIVCAVPFLRDKDLRYFVAGESTEEKEQRLQEAITAHYNNLYEYIKNTSQGSPVLIATGHLFAVGSTTSDSEKMIHVGNLGQVDAHHFPEPFQYIALGHIHRPQKIGNKTHIRYSGSPIPLSFTEAEDSKQVVIIDVEPDTEAELTFVSVPQYRKLLRIKGTLNEVKQTLAELTHEKNELTLWVEVTVVLSKQELQISKDLKELVNNKNIHILAVKVEKLYNSQTLEKHTEININLSDLTFHQVFARRCAHLSAEKQEELRITFDEVLSLLEEGIK
jgi:exonuclease SbcD